MSVVDLHPEELLDKDERGALTADERTRLDAHLDRCAACRAEVVLRADFAAELDGEDRPSALLDLVQGALAAPRPATAPPAAMPTVAAPTAPAPAPAPTTTAPLPDVPTAVGPDAIPGLRRRPRRTAIVLLVAAAVMAASAAGATGLTGRIWLGLRGNSQEVTHASGGAMPKAAPATTSAGATALARPAAPTEAVETASLPEPIAPSPVVAEEPAITATSPVLALTPARAVAVTPARAVAVAPSPVALSPIAPVAPAPSTASALFDSANAARRDGDTATALARYDALDKQFPQTAEARVAKATTGKLLLDRGDAAGALARFDAYLASGAGELREEAMAGRATALERLGRVDDEVRAWAALLAAYPGTPYAVHAKTRVREVLGSVMRLRAFERHGARRARDSAASVCAVVVALALAHVCGGSENEAHAQEAASAPARRIVEVLVAGGGSDAASLDDTVRELLGRLTLVMESQSVGHIDAGDASFRSTARPSLLARVGIDLRARDVAIVTIVDGRTGEVTMRRSHPARRAFRSGPRGGRARRPGRRRPHAPRRA